MQREKGCNDPSHLQSQMQLSMTSDTMLKNTGSCNLINKKMKESENCNNERPWQNLPDKSLHIISSHFRIPDYLNFCRVCHNWRSHFLASNERFVASLPPLICYISARDVNTCLFYDISNENRYRTSLPYFASKFCIGMSCGHIIMGQACNNFWFINPVTGYQHIFYSLPRLNYSMAHSDRFILASTGPNQGILIMVLSRSHYSIWFRRSIDTQWSAYTFASKDWILDMIVFNGRVFVINTQLQVGILSLTSSDVRFLNLKCTPHECSNAKFVTSNGRLFVVDFVPIVWLKIFKVDFAIMAFVEVDDLGDQALFLGDMKGIGISSTAKWGGRNNCVYYLPWASNKVYVYSCTNQYLGSIPIVEEYKNSSARLKCWYFLDQSYSLDYVRDE